ncbi:uncharacterized protein TNCV_2443291 [Trichonephila clavipes]|nr:uncharacterized protein TNCV_2443291 [Trichonephila clavipes]
MKLDDVSLDDCPIECESPAVAHGDSYHRCSLLLLSKFERSLMRYLELIEIQHVRCFNELFIPEKVLARQLIDGYSSRKKKGRPASFQAKMCVVPNDVRFAFVENQCQRWFPSRDATGNVAEKDKKSGPVTSVQNVMSPCALEPGSPFFMANNHN